MQCLTVSLPSVTKTPLPALTARSGPAEKRPVSGPQSLSRVLKRALGWRLSTIHRQGPCVHTAVPGAQWELTRCAGWAQAVALSSARLRPLGAGSSAPPGLRRAAPPCRPGPCAVAVG